MSDDKHDMVVGLEPESTSDSDHHSMDLVRKFDRELTRKIDLHVVPILLIMFLLAYLDRSNLGNARIEGLEKELHMKGTDYNVASMIFYLSYVLFEVPSNIMLKKFSPSTWLSTIMFLWGEQTLPLVAYTWAIRSYADTSDRNLCNVSRTYPDLSWFSSLSIFHRRCLYLMSMYYRRFELQRRLTLLFASGIVAGAFSGLLAYALAKMDHLGGYAGWRWIFIIEGLVTIVISAAAKFIIADWPEDAKFLSAEEKARLLKRLEGDANRGVAKMDRVDRPALKRIVFDWKVWVAAAMYLGAVNTGYVLALFLPTILKELGYTSSEAQIHSIPVYLVAAVCMISFAFATDKLRIRYPFILLGTTIASIGYIILLAGGSLPPNIKYMAVFFVAAGGHSTHPITLGWLANNVSGHYKRAFSTAIQISLGNCAGFVGSNVFLTRQAPRYPTGYATSLALMLVTAITATGFATGLHLENKKRDRGGRDYRLQLPSEQVDNLGDDHPDVRFCK
ncbi:MAG: hypothetical protein M1830_001614 [Pleopsidium flavum]|nr:MAG: hypothetical protein M1830_001614 [Pleopsidium flavum]